MALKSVVDNLDQVDAKHHDLYIEKNGKFELAIDDLLSHPGVAGLRKENGDRRTELKATAEKLKTFTDAFGDEKLEDIIAKLAKYPELETLAKSNGTIDEKKLQELLESRVSAIKGPLDRELAKLRKELDEKNAAIGQYSEKERTRTIHDSIREQLSKLQGFTQSATEDVLMYGERMLDVNEDGSVVTKDNIGITPGIDVSAWLVDMQSKKPHWFGPTVGGGAGGGRSNGGFSGPNPWAAASWNKTEQTKIRAASPQRAEALAAQAGTTVNGLPAQKKT